MQLVPKTVVIIVDKFFRTANLRVLLLVVVSSGFEWYRENIKKIV